MYVFIYLFYSCYSLPAISYFQQSFPFKEVKIKTDLIYFTAHTAALTVNDSSVHVTPKKMPVFVICHQN